MAISMQGSTVPKLTPAILKELEIKLPSIEKQRTIGKAYFFEKAPSFGKETSRT